MPQRNYKFDNIRCVLIFLVVFAHLLEAFDGGLILTVYRAVYTFHMPVFLFVTGYFARFDKKRIFASFIYPYFLFQTLYILLAQHTTSPASKLQYTTPYWLLWYMFACIIYYVLIPMIDTPSRTARVVILSGAVVLSLAIGADKTVGYYMSLSRACVFFPFFIAGYYAGHPSRKYPTLMKINPSTSLPLKIISGVLLTAASITVAMAHTTVRTAQLYGSFPYVGTGGNILTRGALLLLALSWIAFFTAATPERKLRLLSSVGANTVSVYIAHGFIIIIVKYAISIYGAGVFASQPAALALSAALAAVIVLLFGSRTAKCIYINIFTGKPLLSLYARLTSQKPLSDKPARS